MIIEVVLALACVGTDTSVSQLPSPVSHGIILQQGYYRINWHPVAISRRDGDRWVITRRRWGKYPGSLIVRTDPGPYNSVPLAFAYSTEPDPGQTWCNEAGPIGPGNSQLLFWREEDRRFSSMIGEYNLVLFKNGGVVWESWRNGVYTKAVGKAVLVPEICVYRCD